MTKRDTIMDGIVKAIDGKPVDDVMPVLIVTVARALVIDAEGDPAELERLTGKLVHHLGVAIKDAWDSLDEAAARRRLN